MRIPYPERIPTDYAMLGCVVLLLVQLAEGTDPVFALLAFGTIMAWVYSFNILGGLNRVSGMLVFGQGLLGFVVPVVVKAVLREPADSRLVSADLTATVYFAGQLIVLVVSCVVARIRPKYAMLDSPTDKFQTREMAIGATALGFGLVAVLTVFGKHAESGGWATLLRQLDVYILPFALALSVISEIERSNGRKTINALTLIISWYLMYHGFSVSSKEALMTPVAVYVVCCAAMRVNFRPMKLLTVVGVCALMSFYVFPLAQSFHSTDEALRGLTFSEVVGKFEDSGEILQKYDTDRSTDIETNRIGEYYGQEVGLLDRYALIGLDAALIDTVKDGDYMGYVGIYQGMINWIPHFILPDKPTAFNSQTYFHRLPGTNPDDTTTGISFGAFGTAFAMGGWTGLLILLPLVQGSFMLVMDSLFPSVRNTPWIVCVLATMLHLGPEANIDAMTSFVVLEPIKLAFAVLMTRYGVRMFSSLFTGSQRLDRLQQFVEARDRARLEAQAKAQSQANLPTVS